MPKRIRFGVLVPSSNTALEPLTYQIISSYNDPDVEISVHFSRFRVTQIDLSEVADDQFQLNHIVAAARLLADAGVDVIGWSGTTGSWLGFEHDEQLSQVISKETRLPVTTSTLALNRLFEISQAKNIGLVTPYIEAMNDAIRKNYAAISIEITKERERHLNITENRDIAKVSVETLDKMVAGVAGSGGKFITTLCTNLSAAQRVTYWEERHNIVVFDTVSTVIWGMLKAVNLETSRIKGWGRIFEY